MANTDKAIEREPLQLNQESPAQTKPNQEDHEQLELSLLIENKAAQNDNTNVLQSFAIDDAYRNTAENPYRETTMTVPHLVKKVPEEDLTPRPWKTFNQILCFSYLSVVFCIGLGVYANREAWKAKLLNGKGLYGLAQQRARRAVIVSYTAIVVGILLIVFISLAATETI